MATVVWGWATTVWSFITVKFAMIYTVLDFIYTKIQLGLGIISEFFNVIYQTIVYACCCLNTLLPQIASTCPSIGQLGQKFFNKFGGWCKHIKCKHLPICNCVFKNLGILNQILGEALGAFLGSTEVQVKDKKVTQWTNATGLISWLGTYIVLCVIWLCVGPFGLGMPLYIQQASDFTGNLTEVFLDLVNIILVIVGGVFFVLNVMRPFLNLFINIIVQIFFVTIVDVIDPPFRDPSSSRTLTGVYDPASIYDASTAIILSKIHGSLVIVATVLKFGLMIYKVLKRFGLVLLILLKAFASIGLLLGTCCSSAPICCLHTFTRDIILIIGVDIGSCPANQLGNAVCSCSRAEGGPLAIDISCEGAIYSCKQNGNQWEEYKKFRNNPSQAYEFLLVSSGPVKEDVCQNSLQSGANGGRRLLKCQESCLHAVDGTYSFLTCEDGVFLHGDCKNDLPRRLEGELWKEHLKKLKQKHTIPNLKRVQKQERSIPKKLTERHITREEFIDFIKTTEETKTANNILYECDDRDGDTSFENFAWRLHCVVLKKTSEKISLINTNQALLLPLKHAAHVHRYLTEEHSLPELLDNIAKSHNEHFPGDLDEDHHEQHRRLEEIGEKLKKRSLEAMETLKRLNARVLFEPSDPKGVESCPCSDKKVKKGLLKDCPQPTQEEMEKGGCFASLLLYQVKVFGETFSFESMVKNAIQCMRDISQNPEINPASIEGLEKEYLGQTQNLKYCFPMFAPLPYPGKLVWSWNEFVYDQCKPRPGATGTFLPCTGGLYNDSLDIFNWNEMWLSFIPKCVLVRLYNAWCCIQWLITRLLPLQWFSVLWGTTFAFFGTSLEFQNAFSPEWAAQGLPDGTNWFLFSIHSFSLFWFLIFVFIPLFLFWRYFTKPLNILISGIWKKFIIPFILRCFNCKITKQDLKKIEKQQEEVAGLIKFAVTEEDP